MLAPVRGNSTISGPSGGQGSGGIFEFLFGAGMKKGEGD